MAARLPIPRGDDNDWGDILNAFLEISHNQDGTLIPAALTQAGAGTYNKPGSGIPAADLDAGTQSAIAAVASKYAKPGSGIPAADLSSAVQNNLVSAASAVQSVNTVMPTSGNVTLNVADIADVQGAAANNQVLVYNGSTAKWAPGTISSTTVSDATAGAKGILQLAGDLGGTAASPTVPGLAAKAPLASPTFTGTVTVPVPTNATDASTKAYVDSQITGGSTPDATTNAKGKLQLAGDLSGTAALPRVIGINGISVSGTPSTNQVLTAASATAAAWANPSAGFTDPTTTKGDLIIRGTSTTRQPIGTDGQVLTADSTQPTGVAWSVQSADTIIDGTTNKVYSAADKSKLAGITPGATANTLVVGTTSGTAADAAVTNTAITALQTMTIQVAADPTGGTSMRAAWDAATALAVSTGKNTISFPEGTFLAVPDGTTGICLSIPSGIKHITGAGRDRTIIKVQSGCGDYVAVFRSASGADVSGLLLEELTIDQNNTGNPVTTGFGPTSPLFSGQARFCISLNNSTTTTTVRRIRCADMDNINAVSVNGAARDVLIEDNAFELGTVAADHDHSVIYVNTGSTGGVVHITGNTADTSDSLSGHNGGRTFIEAHSGYQIVENNISRGYQKGGNLTGISLTSGEGSRWVNNDFIDCKFGINVWSSTYSTNLGPVGLKGVIIRDNRIQLDLAGWAAFSAGTFGGIGIFLDRASNLPAHDVTITGNHIIFKKGSYTGQAGDVAAMGIIWRRTTPGTIVDRRVTITGNTIDGALAGGMQFWTNGDAFTVDRNIIKNCGQGTVAAGGAVSNGLAVGFFVLGAYTNSSFDGNKILDDQLMPTTSYGFYLFPAATCVNSTAIGNVIPAATAGKIIAATSPTGFLIRMDQTGKLISTGAALSASADTVAVAAHGLSNGTAVQFGQILTAAGVSPGIVYYVVSTAANTFQVAATPGGSAVDITADGTANIVVNTVSLPTGWSAYGSTVVDRTNGITYTQTVAPEGAAWTVASLVEVAPEVLAGATGAVAATYNRSFGVSVATVAALTSGTCDVVLMPVTKRLATSAFRFITGSTAATAPTHQWAALTDMSGNVLAVTADATTTALAASTQFVWSWTAPTVLSAGKYYVHLMIAAGTVPTLLGVTTGASATKIPPILVGPGSTGQTTPPSVGGTLAPPTTFGTGPAYLELA